MIKLPTFLCALSLTLASLITPAFSQESDQESDFSYDSRAADVLDPQLEKIGKYYYASGGLYFRDWRLTEAESARIKKGFMAEAFLAGSVFSADIKEMFNRGEYKWIVYVKHAPQPIEDKEVELDSKIFYFTEKQAAEAFVKQILLWESEPQAATDKQIEAVVDELLLEREKEAVARLRGKYIAIYEELLPDFNEESFQPETLSELMAPMQEVISQLAAP